MMPPSAPPPSGPPPSGPPPVIPWRRARNAEKAEIARILQADKPMMMFPLVNLRDHGLDGLAERGMRVWFAPRGAGVICITNDGTVFPQLPGLHRSDAPALRLTLDGIGIRRVIGPEVQVAALLPLLGVNLDHLRRRTQQPGFLMRLEMLRLPEIPGMLLRPAQFNDRPMLMKWRTGYLREVRGLAGETASEQAVRDVSRLLGGRHLRILQRAGQPVAMTAFYAVDGKMVQVGGVYTPPEWRNRGFARMAVGLHLQEARGKGMEMAVLFAASQVSARAYRGLGFHSTHAMGRAFFSTPQRIEALPNTRPGPVPAAAPPRRGGPA